MRERLIDAIADRLGIDPVEVRRINLIPPEQMPFARPIDTLGTEVTYDSGDYPGLLQRLLDHLRYDELKATLAERRRAGELVGLGFGMFVEKSGLGPFDGVRIAVDAGGRVEVVTGVASVGQGSRPRSPRSAPTRWARRSMPSACSTGAPIRSPTAWGRSPRASP